jgi:multiple sugar transport system permease protein
LLKNLLKILLKNKLWLTVLMLLLALIYLFPMVFVICDSFMSKSEVESNYTVTDTNADESIKLRLIPEAASLEQYYNVFILKYEYLFYFWNSVMIVAPIVAGQLIVSIFAAYAFAKLRFRFRDQLFFVYIVAMMMPFQATLVPNYIMSSNLGILGSRISVILPGIFGAFGVFLLRQFMCYIPGEYIEAALVDGANHFRILFEIVLPLVRTGLAAMAILLVIDNWNMVEQPLIFLDNFKEFPLSIALSDINNTEKGIAFAASAVYMVPMLLIFLYGERYIVEGIQLSGLKA